MIDLNLLSVSGLLSGLQLVLLALVIGMYSKKVESQKNRIEELERVIAIATGEVDDSSKELTDWDKFDNQ